MARRNKCTLRNYLMTLEEYIKSEIEAGKAFIRNAEAEIKEWEEKLASLSETEKGKALNFWTKLTAFLK